MWVVCLGNSVKGCVGACPQKDFTEVLLQRFEALFQDPSSVSLLFICYVPYTMSRKTWHDYTLALSIGYCYFTLAITSVYI